jgi:hypothetical protein
MGGGGGEETYLEPIMGYVAKWKQNISFTTFVVNFKSPPE